MGAGGGSLAYLDAGGALQVGPQSAGAHPGPACYHADYDAWQAMWKTAEAVSYTHLVYCELVSWRAPAEEVLARQPKGFILSGCLLYTSRCV